MSLETMNFDVLVLSDDDPLEPPPPARIGEVRRWFRWFGISCEPTTFGLACRATRSELVSMFGESIEFGREVAIPAELGGLVSQITVAPPPTMLSDRWRGV
ncbi:MAG: hypothetical protein HOH95_01935 [Dehalococcoidia bacterium]|jgi:hypothetical protein|nr:hypothetical protein [Dehalococcoidia bacterium]